MNPKLQASGRKGGTAGKGQSKVRPLNRERAKAMAWARWHPNNDEHQEDYRLAAQAIRDADRMRTKVKTSLMDNQDAKRNAKDGPGSDFDASGAVV